jgi:L-alanine-DL-glutamate epimerase-like enolase superfamily enzyme
VSGVLRVKNGYLPVPNEPGWRMNLNEEKAAKHPYSENHFLRLFEEG